MKTQILTAALVILLSFIFTSCDNLVDDNDGWSSTRPRVTGSGNYETFELDIINFSRIYASNTFDITLRQSDTYKVELTCDDNIRQYLDAYGDNEMAVFNLDPDYNYNDIRLEAELSCPDIREIELTGASRISLAGFESDHNLIITLTGASQASGSIISGATYFSLTGASMLGFTGSCGKLHVISTGASMINLESYSSKDTYIQFTGASLGTVNVDGYLDVNLSGSSILYYTGDPVIRTVTITGASKIIRK